MSKAQVVIALLSLMSTTDAHAYTFPGRPNCPTTPDARKAKITWRQYITLKANPAGWNGAPFSVRFDHSRRLHDVKSGSGPFGNLFAGACYTVTYLGSNQWGVSGYNKVRKESFYDTSKGGDPTTFKINMWGGMFSFDRSGALYDTQNGRVGTLYCELSNQCGDNGDPDPTNPSGGIFKGMSWKTPFGHNSEVSNFGPNVGKVFIKAAGQVLNPSVFGCHIHVFPTHC